MITLTDLFCGAGGSSSGAVQVPGVQVRMAANHWPLAVETHNTNHPNTDHDCADLSQVEPRRYARTDILWASPECTNHSVARGRRRNIDSTPDLFDDVLPDAAAERSRATMWDVVRFAEHHRYRSVVVENVVDAAKWVLFEPWLTAMDALGYRHRVVYLNSMHASAAGDPAPQSRDRMYIVFWRNGSTAPDLDRWTRPRAWCTGCDRAVTAVQAWKNPPRPWGRYRAQYVWRCPSVTCRNTVVEPAWLPASSVIDWNLRGQRIGDRSKPLADKTIARIRAGLAKFGEVDPIIATMRGASKCHPASYPVTTISAGGGHHGLVVPPMLVPVEGREGKHAQPVTAPVRTMTTRSETAVLVPYYGNGTARTSEAPHGTVTTRDRWAMVVPLRNHNTAKALTEPLDTVAAAGNHHGLATVAASLDDCEFRMLEPYEIKQAMAFGRGYVLGGNRREQVRLAGNAVTPPAARDLIHAVTAALS
ncbi:DNA cytosine methyltransferase [Nocardia sp. XZ_19_231]|uniref:DNA cytosine methyltransferase n=1 Tax=Nocardia sp. XZ_19_231 TaxID=2769252 RepID=UPI00189081A7|nr:DNA cytosine methyltransferase [Nocardia sp. XZ_19_231]